MDILYFAMNVMAIGIIGVVVMCTAYGCLLIVSKVSDLLLEIWRER